MILIHRGKEPDSLLRYRKSFPEACYEELPAEPAKDIREQMWAEQNGLCAYCMCKLNSPHDVRIEHYAARNPDGGSYDAASTLNYKHMLGVCHGNSFWPGIKEEDKTCDAHRGNKLLTVNPYDVTSVRKIRYSSDGYIFSEDKDINTDLNETLNLNCAARSLPNNRMRVLLQTKNEIRKKCKDKSHQVYLAELRRCYKRYTDNKMLIPYCGIVIEWLERELKIS